MNKSIQHECIVCKRIFYTNTISRGGRQSTRTLKRQRGTLTCCKKCSGIYYDITRRITPPLYQKISMQKDKIEYLQNKLSRVPLRYQV